MKTLSADWLDQLKSIDPAELAPYPNQVRHESLKIIAGAIRTLFRHLGIPGLSVTAPRYSMAQAVQVSAEFDLEHDYTRWPHQHGECCKEGHTEETRCPSCAKLALAQEKLTKIILTVYPDLDDRSDSQSDYFDYRFSIDLRTPAVVSK